MNGGLIRKLLVHAIVAAWGAASLSGVEIVPDARKIEPLVRDTDEPAIAVAQEKVLGAPARYGAPFPVFIHLSEANADVPRKVANLGGRMQAVLPRLYAGAIPRDAARYISNWPEVAYIEAGKKARPTLDLSRPATGADVVQSVGSGLPGGPYTGRGSIVGIVDTGLSQGHLDFHVNGQAQSRVAQWYPSFAIASVDDEWHGTHVAGIAAGNGFSSAGLYTGMAPGAALIVSKTSFQITDIPLEVNGIFNAAGASPVALNLSLGLMTGPHDGTSGLETSINSSATGTPGSRRIVAVAAGNEATDREHFQVVLPQFGSTTANLTIAPAFVTSPVLPMVDIWADGGDKYDVSVTFTAGNWSVGSDSPVNGATHIEVFFNNSSGANAAGSVTLKRTRNGGTGKVDAYIDSLFFGGTLSNAFTTNAPAGTIIEPANGGNVLAVGAFNTRPPASGSYGAIGDISSFSSLGPTRDGRGKPDIAAPGAVIYSARSRDPFSGPGSPPATVPGNDNYAIMQGTSMAAPHVTGIAALVWESNPSLTGAQMRARLKKTAILPGSVPAPDNTWGYGKVNALQAVSRTVATITAPATATPGATVALSSGNSSGAFDPTTYSYTLSYEWSLAQKPAGSGATLASNSSSPSFTPDVPGNYTVSLAASQSAPAGVPAGTDNAVIHVNNVPTAVITGPSSTDNVATAAFSGLSSSDPDGQALQLHWVLVTRPPGSGVIALSPVGGTDNATLNPDIAGSYEIGLRADDGLDNSALAIKAFHAGPVPPSGGGGGGCSVARPGRTDAGADAGTVLFLTIASAGILALRHRVRRSRK